VLVLGGTAEARELAEALDRAGLAVVSSLAGRTATRRPLTGQVRVGRFGGSAALARWLGEQNVAAVVDATHPFATRISASAAEACSNAGVPLLRIERPGWREQAGDRWYWSDDLAGAATMASELGRRIFLAIGRQGVAAFADVASSWFLIRCVEPPAPPLPPHHELLLDRGPYTVAGELELLTRHAIDLIVTKDSGGESTWAKLEAACRLGLPVVVVRRPAGRAEPTVADAVAAFAWVRAVFENASEHRAPRRR
jgi:precorrin-6A/cobalt-precorrin-6A reductase